MSQVSGSYTKYNLLMEVFLSLLSFALAPMTTSLSVDIQLLNVLFVYFIREQQFPGAVWEAAEARHVGQRRLHAVANPPVSGRRRRFQQLASLTARGIHVYPAAPDTRLSTVS